MDHEWIHWKIWCAHIWREKDKNRVLEKIKELTEKKCKKV